MSKEWEISTAKKTLSSLELLEEMLDKEHSDRISEARELLEVYINNLIREEDD